jgi:cell division protein FtsQ
VVLIAYGLEAGHRWLTADGRFPVTEIRVSGHALLYEGEVLAMAGVERGTNILKIDPEIVRAHLLASGWIRGARVERRPPGRILLTIEERHPWLLAAGEVPRFVDREGCVFPAAGKEERLDLPLLRDPGERARTVVPALAAAFPPGEKWFDEKVLQVTIDPLGSVSLIERDHRTTVHLGVGDFAEKAMRLRTVLAEWAKTAEAYEEIDLRFDGQAIARRAILPPEEGKDEEKPAENAGEASGRESV